MEEEEFLIGLLRRYNSKTMLESWVRLGNVRTEHGPCLDSDKIHAVQILKRSRAFCKRGHDYVYAVDVGCFLLRTRECPDTPEA